MGLLLRGGKERGEGGEGRDKEKEGEGKGERDGRESLGGQGGREGKGLGKRGGEGKFRGARPPKSFFLEPRLIITVQKHNINTYGAFKLKTLINQHYLTSQMLIHFQQFYCWILQ